MTVRADFRAIVGLDTSEDDTPNPPSESLRRVWVMVADTYVLAELAPLWKYHIHMAEEYRQLVGTPSALSSAFIEVMVQVCAFGRSPAPAMFPQLQPHIDAIEAPSWGKIQVAVEALAVAWADLGL